MNLIFQLFIIFNQFLFLPATKSLSFGLTSEKKLFRLSWINISIFRLKILNFPSSFGSISMTIFFASLANVLIGEPVALVSNLEPREIIRSAFWTAKFACLCPWVPNVPTYNGFFLSKISDAPHVCATGIFNWFTKYKLVHF